MESELPSVTRFK